MGWNGADLVTEFSTQLGDTSTSFKSKVLGWINEIQDDINTRFDWPFLRKKGKKILTADTEEHNLKVAAPTVPSSTASSGGSLVDATGYRVKITFYESSTGAETEASAASTSVTMATPNLTLSITGIEVSSESLVTARKIYLSKAGETFYLAQTISDNTTTTASITADTDSTLEPPDYSYIRRVDGSPFLEGSGNRYLDYETVSQLRTIFTGTWSTGTPEFWASIDEDTITVYPVPSSDTTVSFYYFRTAPRIYNSSESQPIIPIWLKSVLKEGVLSRGYEYRERDGAQQKLSNYDSLLKDVISRAGRSVKGSGKVRDVVGSADGFILT